MILLTCLFYSVEVYTPSGGKTIVLGSSFKQIRIKNSSGWFHNKSKLKHCSSDENKF